MFEKLGFSSYERRAIYLLVILILGGVIYRVLSHDRLKTGTDLWVKNEQITEGNLKLKNTSAITPENPLNINTASEEELQLLPGIGPVTAKRIIEYRNNVDLFSSVERLDDVPGIGPKKMLRLEGLICVQDSSKVKTTLKQ